jgi:hypothetical protein
MAPAEFGKLVADEADKWRKVVEFAGVSVDQPRHCRIAFPPVNDARTVAGRLRAAVRGGACSSMVRAGRS